MLSERMLTTVVRAMTDKTLTLHPVPEGALPDPVEGRPYTLYVHVPFCELSKKFGAPVITNDGVTIAKEIELKDEFENMGAQLVREVA